jgi:hypothetical protein
VKLGTFRRQQAGDDIETDQAERERRVREARLEQARRQPTWTEVPETRLVRRGRLFVDAETDLVYMHHRGVVFEPGSAHLTKPLLTRGFRVSGENAPSGVATEWRHLWLFRGALAGSQHTKPADVRSFE